MLVIVVGDQSCIGKIRAMLEQEDETETPLQQKLEKLANDIGKFALVSSIVIMVVLFARFGIFKIQNPSWDTEVDLKKMLGYFIIGITVIVVAIPEGLPLSVTLSLAFSVKKMLKDQNLVRRM
jgi:Ca2+ transporting ATPase